MGQGVMSDVFARSPGGIFIRSPGGVRVRPSSFLDGFQTVISICEFNQSVDSDSNFPAAQAQSILNLNLIDLLDPLATHADTDGSAWTFGFWNDLPVAGTTLAWQVVVFDTFPMGVPNPKLFFVPMGTSADPQAWLAGNKKFIVAANGIPHGQVSDPHDGVPLYSPPAMPQTFVTANAISVKSVIRTSAGVTNNYSATGVNFFPGPGVTPPPESQTTTDATPLQLGTLGASGQFTFGPSQCASFQEAACVF